MRPSAYRLRLRGPYRYWRHAHQFESCDEGTRLIDLVRYGLPGGAIVHKLVAQRDIERIFAFRQRVLGEIFANGS